MQKTNYTKWIFIIVFILVVVGIVYYFDNSQSGIENDVFDPSIYFEGDPVTQEEIDSTLTKDEQEEIDRIFNEESTKTSE